MGWFRRIITSDKAQGLVEYSLILALISVVVVGSLGGIGGKVTDTFDKIAGEEIDDDGHGHVVTDEDFEWVSWGRQYKYNTAYEATNEEGLGYYKYVGDSKSVEIPHTINGHPMTSYFRMFEDSDVEKVTSDNPNIKDMSWMFDESLATTLDVSGLDTRSVIDMESMFHNTKATSINLDGFDVRSVVNMRGMFYDSQVEYIDLSHFETSNVENISYMFRGAEANKLNLKGLSTNKITDMDATFSGVSADIIGLEDFDTSSVTSMWGTFSAFKGAEIDISGWDTKNVQDMGAMFSNGDNRISKVEFGGGSGFAYPAIVVGGNNIRNIQFGNKWTTRNVETMDYIFRGSVVKGIDSLYKGWDLSGLTTVRGLFFGVNPSSNSINMDDYNINYSKITDMINMFTSSDTATINLGNKFDSSNVGSMRGMFFRSKATSITGLDKLNTSNVTDMHSMFAETKLTSLDLRGFDTRLVTDMFGMFYKSRAESMNLSSFDTGKVTDMANMFSSSSVRSLNLTGFDTKLVTNMAHMFDSTLVQTLDLSSFDTSPETYVDYMFRNSHAGFGYAKTQSDANRFNGSKEKPSGLTFTVR